MGRAVVDASVVVTLENARAAEREPTLTVLGDFDSLHAPDHLDIECLSALRGLMLGGRITTERYVQAAMALPRLPIQRHPIAPLVARILRLSANASSYDAAYVALAELLDAPLVTRDHRLAGVPGVSCRIITVD